MYKTTVSFNRSSFILFFFFGCWIWKLAIWLWDYSSLIWCYLYHVFWHLFLFLKNPHMRGFLWLFKSTNYGLNLNPHQISSIKVLLYCKFLWFCGLILKNTKLECWLKNFTAKLYFRNLNAWTITLISLFVRLPIPWSFFHQTINFISFKLLKTIKFVFWL